MRINAANRLTLLRLLIIPFFLIFTIRDNAVTRIVALFLFIIASLTDLYDGRIARKLNQVTTLGTFLDPLADKLLIAAAFISFVEIPEIHVPSWMIVLIIGREFLITGLRTLAVSQGRILPAQPAGKFKTTSQMVTIIATLVILAFNSLLESLGLPPQEGMMVRGEGWETLAWILKGTPYWLTFVTTVLTIVSGYIYVSQNIDLINDDAPPR